MIFHEVRWAAPNEDRGAPWTSRALGDHVSAGRKQWHNMEGRPCLSFKAHLPEMTSFAIETWWHRGCLSLLDVEDCDQLHAGVDEMRKNTDPFTGGINFDVPRTTKALWGLALRTSMTWASHEPALKGP